MTLVISDSHVEALADVMCCIDAIEQAFVDESRGRVVMPPRVNLAHDATFLRLMPALMPDSGLMGYKAFHGSMANGVRYLVVLCRIDDGQIVALIDGKYLTALRTGATSGVATRYLAPDRLVTVGVIGSGLEARTNLAAVAAVRPVRDVRVYSRSVERRGEFAAHVTETLGVPARSCMSPMSAVDGADVVVVATNTGMNGPVAFEGKWMQPGQHVVSIGATSPFLRELDQASFERADRLVLDVPLASMSQECGDVLAMSSAELEQAQRYETLATVVAAGAQERAESEITLFKSVGSAAQDLAAARVVYEAAVAQGAGYDIGDLVSSKQF